jgi:hypothetical protein
MISPDKEVTVTEYIPLGIFPYLKKEASKPLKLDQFRATIYRSEGKEHLLPSSK